MLVTKTLCSKTTLLQGEKIESNDFNIHMTRKFIL